MRMRAGLTTAVLVLWMAGNASAQQCDTVEECMAGMCQGGTCVGVPLNGGTCDDGNPCTTNDTCVSGVCQGTPAAGAPCQDGLDCTTNDVCTDIGAGTIFCMGSTAPPGTRCAGGCGGCEATGLCLLDTALNSPCVPFGGNLGPCFVGRCTALSPQPFQIASCTPALKTCPEDGNLCTGEFCNPATGECETAPLPARPDCFPFECHTCAPSTGQCVPANSGAPCDDFNVCTASTVCSPQGMCISGVAQQTPTPTRTPGASSPTPTATVASTRTSTAVSTATPSLTPGTPTATPTQAPCVGDCNNNGEVSVSELITGVNIALDRVAFDQCEAFDLNGNSDIEVDELVAGVNSSIRGCVGSSAVLGR